MTISRRQVLSYALMPQVLPRIRNLFGQGFGFIAWYLAIIFRSARLLPADSSYIRQENFGRYGIFAIIASAAQNIEFKWRNIDQIIIFICVLSGIALLFLQFVLLLFAIFASTPAIAQGNYPLAQWFTVADPSQHIDRIILDRVFGVAGIFDSCVSTSVPCLDMHGAEIIGANGIYPFPIHVAIHALFEFYNWSFAIVAAIVILYFVVVVTVETATTGTPFGQRFSKAWVPFRLAMFAMIMIPTSSGLNLGQITVLHIAKHAGALATNAWIKFNADLSTTYLGDGTSLLAISNPPEVTNLAQFMFTAKACEIVEGRLNKTPRAPIKAYIVRGITDGLAAGGDNAIEMAGSSYNDAYQFSQYSNIVIRFGERDEKKYPTELGFVEPTCGQISIEPHDMHEISSQGIYEDYYNMIEDMWNNPYFEEAAICLAQRTLSMAPNLSCHTPPDANFAASAIEHYQTILAKNVIARRDEHVASLGGKLIPPELSDKGWAGAAIWFDRISQMNGAFTSAILNIPVPNKMPILMEEVKELRAAALKTPSSGTSSGQAYNPSLGNGTTVSLKKYPFKNGIAVANLLNVAYTVFDKSGVPHAKDSSDTGNQFINLINFVLGTNGIFDIRENASTHPLAQITALGKSVVERSIQSLILAGIGFVGEKVAGMVFPAVGPLAQTATTFFLTFGMVGIVVGFILAYITPFMPMLYFIFAVSGWVKSIFEAMVAMPLWAIAHLRIDGGGDSGGQGLPGKDASAGYILLLEILLRPVMMIFGLLASITIFGSTVVVFNSIFDLVIENMSGHGPVVGTITAGQIEFYKGPVDEFFYTILYVMVVYMIGSSSFKLIDEIPNQIMRWISFQVPTFSEGIQDPAGQIQQKVYSGSLLMSNQMNSGSQRLAILSQAAS